MLTSLFGLIGISLMSSGIDGAKTGGGMAPAEIAMNRLVEGNKRFVSETMGHSGMGADRRGVVAKGQSPHTIVVTCADSRVSPELLFDQGLGDLFVIRVAGNIVDTYALASIEYAAEHLHSPLLVILGHERCGAVGAAKSAFEAAHGDHADAHADTHADKHADDHGAEKGGEHKKGNLEQLVEAILPAVSETAGREGDWLDMAIRRNVDRTILDCFNRSEPLKMMVMEDKLVIKGAVYDLDTGEVEFLPAAKLSGSIVKIHKK